MDDWEEWRESVRDIPAGGSTWWWWWWYIRFIQKCLDWRCVYKETDITLNYYFKLLRTWTTPMAYANDFCQIRPQKMNSCYIEVVSIELYGWTTWTLIKRMEKKFDGNYKRMLQAVLNKFWRQHPTKQQLYFLFFFFFYTLKTSRNKLQFINKFWRQYPTKQQLYFLFFFFFYTLKTSWNKLQFINKFWRQHPTKQQLYFLFFFFFYTLKTSWNKLQFIN